MIGIALLQKENPHMMDGKFISFDNLWLINNLTPIGILVILLVIILTIIDSGKTKEKEEK